MITKPSSSDALRILIRDCLIHMRIGILESEQNRAQPVLVTVECTLSAGRRYYEDIKEKDITQTVDYGPLHDFITHQLPKKGHISLLESAAEQIVYFCFRDPRVESVVVRLEKTDLFADTSGAGIELRRSRS